ncbi:MAG: hypothetical protein WDN75_01420 [Bacteroidota bacterium]
MGEFSADVTRLARLPDRHGDSAGETLVKDKNLRVYSFVESLNLLSADR